MVKIILFNGPPGSGKDTAARMALDLLGDKGYHYKMAAPLKDAVHALFGLSNIPTDYFESAKEIPNDNLFGMSPRQAYIWLSEEVIKPKFGNDFFTRVAVLHLGASDNLTVVVSDCGFKEEVQGLVNHFGKDNVMVVQMHRQGCDFTSDSRQYVAGAKTTIIVNNHTLQSLLDNVAVIVEEFKNGK